MITLNKYCALASAGGKTSLYVSWLMQLPGAAVVSSAKGSGAGAAPPGVAASSAVGAAASSAGAASPAAGCAAASLAKVCSSTEDAGSAAAPVATRPRGLTGGERGRAAGGGVATAARTIATSHASARLFALHDMH